MLSYVDSGPWFWGHTTYLEILDLVRGDLRGEPDRLLVAQRESVTLLVAGLTFVEAPVLQQRFQGRGPSTVDGGDDALVQLARGWDWSDVTRTDVVAGREIDANANLLAVLRKVAFFGSGS